MVNVRWVIGTRYDEDYSYDTHPGDYLDVPRPRAILSRDMA
jgi:hypothetical protein